MHIAIIGLVQEPYGFSLTSRSKYCTKCAAFCYFKRKLFKTEVFEQPYYKKGLAFASPALEAIEGIVIWEGNYTPDILFSAFKFMNFSDLFAVVREAEGTGQLTQLRQR
jgi:hypothetical protein